MWGWLSINEWKLQTLREPGVPGLKSFEDQVAKVELGWLLWRSSDDLFNHWAGTPVWDAQGKTFSVTLTLNVAMISSWFGFFQFKKYFNKQNSLKHMSFYFAPFKLFIAKDYMRAGGLISCWETFFWSLKNQLWNQLLIIM